MKICLLATFPNPNIPHTLKGGYRRTTELLKVLSRTHQVSLLVATFSQPWPLRLSYCTSVSFASSKLLPIQWVRTADALYNTCRTHDILIAYNPTLHTLPSLISKTTSCKLVIDYVDLQGVDLQGTEAIKSRLFRHLKTLAEVLLLRSCRNYLTITEYLHSRIKLYRPDANVLLFRGVFSAPTDPEHRSEDKETIDIFYLGSMFSSSGVDHLIKAFAGVRAQNARLFIVGSGPEKKSLEDVALRMDPGRIIFRDLSDRELHKLLQRVDILTLPHLKHRRNSANFPSKLIEYLWAGKAILATDVGEVSQVLTDGVTALVIREGDVEALREGLETLIQNRSLRERLGRNARSYFEANFSPDVVANRLNDFLERIV